MNTVDTLGEFVEFTLESLENHATDHFVHYRADLSIRDEDDEDYWDD